MQRTCANSWCQATFEVTDDDLAFYNKVSPVFGGKKYLIPPPSQCPTCRQQRRMTWRNERKLYTRKCDLTGKEIISCYSPDKPFKVYESTAWHSDKWDGLDYGFAFKFGQPLFQQMDALRRRVPRISLMGSNLENCAFSNHIWYCKNCYLCFDMGFCEDVLYSFATYHSTNCVDCTCTRGSELSCELVDSTQCYHSISLQHCRDCQDALFCFDCHQCKSIAFCWNLRNREYCIFNEQVTKDEFERSLHDIRSGSYQSMCEHREKYQNVLVKAIRKCTSNVNVENCKGDYIQNSRNCQYCYDANRCDELRYCTRMDEKIVTAMDLDNASIVERAYEGTSIAGHHILFNTSSYDPSNSDLLYCDWLRVCSDCLACIGLKHKQYCILNKQYTKEEYERLVPKIIEKMRADGEWGEFFPVPLSPFAYNETVAQEYYPLTKKEVEQRGFLWREEKDKVPNVAKVIPAERLPDSINDIPDDILNWAITCEVTKRPFRIIRQELEFYRKMRLPVPRLHPDERHRRRMALRNPRKLWDRPCMKCQKPMQTTYSPDRPEIVYCEECYLQAVY